MSATAGRTGCCLRWFEFDITWQHIRALKSLGLAKRIRLAHYRP